MFAFQRGPLSKCRERKVWIFILRCLLGIRHHHGHNPKLLTIISHGHQKRATAAPLLYSHTANTTQVFGGRLREDAQGKAKTIVHMLTCPRSQGWRSQEKDLNTSNPVGYVPVPLLAPTSCPRSIPTHRALSPEVRSLRAKPELLRPEERTSGLLGKSPLLKTSPAFPEWELHILECSTVCTFWWLFG